MCLEGTYFGRDPSPSFRMTDRSQSHSEQSEKSHPGTRRIPSVCSTQGCCRIVLFPVEKYFAELLAALFQDRGHILEVHWDRRPFHELWKSLFYAFARDHAAKCCDDRLPFFRQRPIDEQRRGMGMRRAARQTLENTSSTSVSFWLSPHFFYLRCFSSSTWKEGFGKSACFASSTYPPISRSATST